jgi:putative membrane protein
MNAPAPPPSTSISKLFALARKSMLVIVAVLLTIFVLQNIATIQVNFLTWSMAIPSSLAILLVFGLGLASGYLLHAVRAVRR